MHDFYVKYYYSPLEITDQLWKREETAAVCVCGWSDLSPVTVAAISCRPRQQNVPVSDHRDAEEELCVVKFVLRVSFADRVWIGERV